MNRVLVHFCRAVVLLFLLGSCTEDPATDGRKPDGRHFAPIGDPHLPNAHRLTSKVITGAQPENAMSFKALKKLGVKTIISVDGARPDIDGAHKEGLRYIHLPIGYDGISDERVKQLAKAVDEAKGNVYIHCHHGKHRGPAAAAVACVALGTLSNEDAASSMKVLGTGEGYLGLWDAARRARPIPGRELKAFQAAFTEVAAVPPLAEAMSQVDGCIDQVKACAVAGWRTPPEHPDLDPPHEALKLRELFTEIMRTDDFGKRPEEFRSRMSEISKQAGELADKLRAWKEDHYAGTPPREADALLKSIQGSCAGCHKQYRNNVTR